MVPATGAILTEWTRLSFLESAFIMKDRSRFRRDAAVLPLRAGGPIEGSRRLKRNSRQIDTSAILVREGWVRARAAAEEELR